MSPPARPTRRRARACVVACLVVAAGTPAVGSGQAVSHPSDVREEPFDSADVLGRARREQARFEARRVRALPAGWGSSGGPCDEQVGRFCTWYDEGDWLPDPEPEEVRLLRADLVVYLDSVQSLLPGDDWVLGQRVWYRAEAAHWRGALNVARDCGRASPWWCAALEGFALHGLGDFEAAEAAFDRALTSMEPERAARWRVPRRAVDGGVRDFLDRGAADGDPERALAWMWTLADPLYLVRGNDRKTAHFARWAVATLRERARNPFLIGWGRDLEELTVRHGWEIGWERQRSTGLRSEVGVVGHKHPEGRDFMPPGDALRHLATTGPEDLVARRARPRSLYAPAYAPVLLPLEGQVAVFPRADSFVVVVTHYLPEDTTWHRTGPDRRPWMDPVDAVGEPVRSGVFLVPAPGGLGGTATVTRSRVRPGRLEGGLTLAAPAGPWLLSVESWSPSGRRAGRTRRGLVYEAVPGDVLSVSDLLLVEGGRPPPASLEEAAAIALPRPRIAPDEPVAVVWEMGGLGRSPTAVGYALSVERSGGSVLRRLGRAVGLVGPDRPLALAWEEPGPDAPGPVLRALDLTMPELESGTYRVRLRVTVTGRAPIESVGRFEVR